MANMSVPESPRLYYTYYKDLGGVDWSAPETEVSRKRASDILNMIPQDGEYVPIKRRGWRAIHTFDSEVVASYHDSYKNKDYICTQDKVYVYNGTTFTEIAQKSFSNIIPFNGKIYLTGEDGMYEIESDSVTAVAPAVPWTVIKRNPDGTGGDAYYGVNAFTVQRMISFWGDAESTTFTLYPDDDHLCIVTKVEVRDANGNWASTSYTAVTGASYQAYGQDGQVHTYTHQKAVTLSSPHPSSVIDGGLGLDSVRVTVDELDLTVAEGTTRNGYKRILGDKIIKSTITKAYGAVNMDRLFVVVDDNKIYYSEPSDITSFPDDNYVVAGNSAPIVGLHRKDNYLVAITADSNNHSVFLIKSNTAVITTTTETETGEMTTTSEEQQFFSVRPATSGTGAVAKKSFAVMVDEPLFLGKTGIYAIVGNSLNTETILANRSTYVNPKLIYEKNLKNAVGVVWKTYYILCVNSHCYILDSNVATRDQAGNRVYEAYYWDNVPATSFLAYGENLWFGTEDGRWCRFNTDFDDYSAYIDDGEYDEDAESIEYIPKTGTPVTAVYKTALDDDNYPQYYKNLNKKGCVITMLPSEGSSVEAYFSKDGEEPILFTKASVGTNKTKIDTYTLKKVKKYKRLQFIFKNSKAEPWGLVKFVKTWSMGNFAK